MNEVKESAVYWITTDDGKWALSLDGVGSGRVCLKEKSHSTPQGWMFKKNRDNSYRIYPQDAEDRSLTGASTGFRPDADWEMGDQSAQRWELVSPRVGVYQLFVQSNPTNKNKLVAARINTNQDYDVKIIYHRDGPQGLWIIERMDSIERVENAQEKAITISCKKGESTDVKILGIEGGVFISEPLPHNAKQLWEINDSNTKDHILTTSETEKNTLVSEGWKVTDNKLWVYPADQDGMVPLLCYYDKQAKNHIYTTSTIEKQELDNAQNVESRGKICSLLPLGLAGSNVAPLLRVHNEKNQDTTYTSDSTQMNTILTQAGSVKQPSLESSTLTVGAALDKTFGANFGPVGEAVGEVLGYFDFKVETYKRERKKVDPYWSKLLREKELVPATVLNGFKKTTDVYTWDTSIKNVANPERDRIKVKVQLKLFASDQGPALQFRAKLVGEYCLDDVIPKEVRRQQSIPVIGPFLVKDITFIFATAKTMYDPSLDAGIERGFNIYANIDFDKPKAGSERPKIMQAITQITGVKSCALHLGLGLSTVGAPKISLIAEMALQWRQYNIVPALEAPVAALSNISSSVARPKPPDGFAFPCIETDYFAVRFTRSDFQISGELSVEGANVALGISSDLAVEISKLEDIGIPDARLVFTGGVSIGSSLEIKDTPEVSLGFAFTMNGTGRNTIGELTGETLTGDKAQYNTTDLQIGDPATISISQAAVELSVEATLGNPVIVKPEKFGIMAKGKFMDIEGEIAFKINLDKLTDMTAFILIIEVEKVTIIDFLMLGSTLWGSMMRKTASELMPDDWKEKVNEILDISIRDALIYFVPVKNSIGGVIYEDTGYVIAGKLDLYGWQTKLYAVYDKKAGVAMAGEMDPINLEVGGKKIFSLQRSSKSEQLTPDSLREVTMNGNGARMACRLMKAGLDREADIKLLVDARGEFLGVANLELHMSLDNGTFRFSTSLDVGIMKGNLNATFTAQDDQGRTRLSGSGNILAGVNLPRVETPLGIIGFDKIGFHAGFTIDTWVSGAGGQFSFTVTAGFSLGSFSKEFELKLTIGFNWSELGDMIVKEIKRIANNLASALFNTVEAFYKGAKDDLIYIGENPWEIIKDVYGLTASATMYVLKGAGYVVGEVTEVLGIDGVIDQLDSMIDSGKDAIVGLFVSHRVLPLPEHASKKDDPNNYWSQFFWDDLGESNQANWANLGWSKYYWDGSENSFPVTYITPWGSLSESQKTAARNLGYDKVKWDQADYPKGEDARMYSEGGKIGPDAYWENYNWADIGQYEQKLWAVLEWQSSSWDSGNNTPNTVNQKWPELNDKQKAAAFVLGYNSKTWIA